MTELRIMEGQKSDRSINLVELEGEVSPVDLFARECLQVATSIFNPPYSSGLIKKGLAVRIGNNGRGEQLLGAGLGVYKKAIRERGVQKRPESFGFQFTAAVESIQVVTGSEGPRGLIEGEKESVFLIAGFLGWVEERRRGKVIAEHCAEIEKKAREISQREEGLLLKRKKEPTERGRMLAKLEGERRGLWFKRMAYKSRHFLWPDKEPGILACVSLQEEIRQRVPEAHDQLLLLQLETGN